MHAVMRELDRRKRTKLQEEKRRREKEKDGVSGQGQQQHLGSGSSHTAGHLTGSRGTPIAAGGTATTTTTSAGQTPVHSGNPWRQTQQNSTGSRAGYGVNGRPHASSNSPLPPAPNGNSSGGGHVHAHTHDGKPGEHHLPPHPHPPSSASGTTPTSGVAASANRPARRPPPTLVKARIATAMKIGMAHLPPRPSFATTHSSSSTPLHQQSHHTRGRRPYSSVYGGEERDSPYTLSRSPSPISRRPGGHGAGYGRDGKQREREGVLEELAKNGFDHVRIEGYGGLLGGLVGDEDVRQFFDGFKVDKVRFFGPLSFVAFVH